MNGCATLGLWGCCTNNIPTPLLIQGGSVIYQSSPSSQSRDHSPSWNWFRNTIFNRFLSATNRTLNSDFLNFPFGFVELVFLDHTWSFVKNVCCGPGRGTFVGAKVPHLFPSLPICMRSACGNSRLQRIKASPSPYSCSKYFTAGIR
jgi:hypothetical protein